MTFTLAPGLTETRRLSWSGTCDGQGLFDIPVVIAGGDVFRVGSANVGLGDHGDEGFAFVTANPLDDGEAAGAEASN